MRHPRLFPFIFFFALIFVSAAASAQTFSIGGTTVDSLTGSGLPAATVVLLRTSDTSIVTGTSTDTTGKFEIKNVAPGNYLLRIMMLGYRRTMKHVSVTNENVDLGTIMIRARMLKTAVVNDKQIRMTQSGDTTAFNADAYKTHPDATADDLVNKMPGVQSTNGNVTVNGEQVQQVLVDGKPFFGDDPSLALKNMPADVVDKIQVYDKASDQAQFTGFDDGNSKKTMNIITKKAKANGKFGKLYGGYGTDNRYSAGGNMSYFNGGTRLTLLGMSNNINMQNFSTQDLFGAMGSGGGGHGGGHGGHGGGGSMGNFMVGQQSGITTTHSFGFNYTDNWGQKIKVTSSYFFNASDNNTATQLSRNYFAPSDSGLVYNEKDTANAMNFNHRLNFRMEYNIDSMNALVFTPRISFQNYNTTNFLNGLNMNGNEILQNSTNNNSTSKNSGYNFGAGLVYRHKFRKEGRTVSFDAESSVNDKIVYGTYYSRNFYYPSDSIVVDQHSRLASGGNGFSLATEWTEPLGKKGQLMFSYTPQTLYSKSDRVTNNLDATGETYTQLDTVLSNTYTQKFFAHRGGANYSYNGDKLSIRVGTDYQYGVLSGTQQFPAAAEIQKVYTNLFPIMRFNYKFSKEKNLRIIYRTSANLPQVTQLQTLVDNSNPLLLKTGNPTLKQDYEQTFIAHYGSSRFDKATGFFTFLYFNMAKNYITNSTITANADTLLANNILLKRGSQLTMPVNMNGYRNGRAFFMYTFVLEKIKCNLGVNTTVGYSHTPALINNAINLADNYSAGPGLTFSSNISEKLDFMIGYSGSFNFVKNSLSTQSNSNYFSHTASLRFNWIFWKGMFINTSLDQTFYNGLGQGYNTNFLLWNASYGYKFLKKQNLEVKASAFDLLNQNTSVSRNVTETYIEDDLSKVLKQYYMLTVTWSLKKFDVKMPDDANQNQPNPMWHH